MSDRSDSHPIQQTAASHLQADGDINIGSITQIVNQGNATRGIPIDFCWREVCQSMLATTKALTSNLFTTRVGTTFGLDDIYVPLGLVEKQPLQKRHEDVPPELGSQLYRETQKEITPIAHNQFFEQVLEQGVSPKSRGRLIALTGEAGAGKTTLLQKIAHWVLENDLGLPIWVGLGQIRDSTLSEYLTGDWLSTAKANVTPEIKEDLEKQCREGRVWLLLDGLDEMTNPTEARFIASLQSGWVTGVRMVLSCRLNVWEIAQNSLSGFDVYRNLDFEPEQVEQFIRRWFAKTGEAQTGGRLLQALNNPGKERIQDLVKYPLRCSLLCRSWQLGEGELPDTKAELYAQFMDAIYDEWKDWTPEPFPTRSAAKRELNKALGRLARWAIDKEKSRFVLRHDLVSSELGEPDEPLFLLALKLGLLNVVGVDPKKPLKNVYAFYHPTFEEYFAALAIDDWHFFLNHIPDNPSHPDASYRIFEPQWKETFLLWLGRKDKQLKEQKEQLIQALIEFKDKCENFYWYRSVFLAASGISEFSSFSKTKSIVEQLILWSFGYLDTDEWKWVNFLNTIKKGAITLLQESYRPLVVATLIEVISIIPDELFPRYEAIESLGKMGSGYPEATAFLIDLIHTNRDKRTLIQAAESLGEIVPGHPEAIKVLIDLLIPEQESYILRAVAKSLGKIGVGNPNLIFGLIELLHKHQKDLKELDSLACVGLNVDFFGRQLPSAFPLEPKSKEEEMYVLIIQCLGQIGIGYSEVIHALIELLQISQSICIRHVVAESLGKLGDGNQRVIDALVDLLQNPQDWVTCDAAAKGLGQIGVGNSEVIDALIDLLHVYTHYANFWAATKSLSQIAVGNSKVIAILIDILSTNSHPYIVNHAVMCLGQIALGNLDAKTALTELLHTTRSQEIRRFVAKSLWQVDPGNPEAIAVLAEQLCERQNEFDRCQAAIKLGQIVPGHSEVISYLIMHLCNGELNPRHTNEDFLGFSLIAKPDEATWLIALLQNSQNVVVVSDLSQAHKQVNPFHEVVSSLKGCLTNQIRENDFQRWEICYEVLWYCAQNIPYPDFYQVWQS